MTQDQSQRTTNHIQSLEITAQPIRSVSFIILGTFFFNPGEGTGGGTLGISEWGCTAGTLRPLTYTRASSAEFCYPILE